MDWAALLLLALKASIVLNVFAIGLTAGPQDALSLLRRPRQLLRAQLSMNVVMPLFAAGLAAATDLHPAEKIALVALAVSPIPPLLPRKALKSGGDASYTIGLLVAAAVIAILFIPLVTELLGMAFAIPLHTPPGAVARLVLVTVIAPLAAGMVVRWLAPRFAARAANSVAVAAMIALVASAVPVMIGVWPGISALVGNGTVAAIAAFVIVGLAAGHLLGGPDPEDRVVLALCTACRHPGVALAIASANFPEQKLALPAVLLYLIVSGVVTVPYLVWSRRRRSHAAGA